MVKTGNLSILIKCLLLKILNAKNPGCKIAGFDQDFSWVDEKLNTPGSPLFSHSGGVGDILFSLYFCKEITEYYGKKQFDYFIVSGKNGLSHGAAEFLRPLLESQSFIRSAEIVSVPPAGSIRLEKFRDLKINFSSSDIHSWYYNLSRIHLPREFWKPVISVAAERSYQDKIFICLTNRYRNVHINCRCLEPFREHLCFLGLSSEYQDFCREFFDIRYQPCKNMLQMAEFISGGKGFIGNQSGIYSLAECMKIPRILLSPDFVDYHGVIIPGPHNNHPQGGWNEEVISTEKMVKAVESLLAKE